MWYWFGAGYGNLEHLSNPYISAFDTPMLGALIALIVQLFFCYRIRVLSQSWWLPSIAAAASIAQAVAAFISGVRGHIVGNVAATRTNIDSAALYIWLIGSAVADVLIAAAMTYLLLKARHEHRQTNAILYRLVRLSVETNVVSATVALICVIVYFAAPGTNYFISATFFLGKIYSNTLLVTLNNRFFLSRAGDPPSVSKPWNSTTKNSRDGHIVIHQHTTSATLTDVNPTFSQYKVQTLSANDRQTNDVMELDHFERRGLDSMDRDTKDTPFAHV